MTTPNQPEGTEGTEALEKWETVVASAFPERNVAVPLAQIYARIDGHPRTKINPHWKDKVRQVLQRSPLFENVSKGVWQRILTKYTFVKDAR